MENMIFPNLSICSVRHVREGKELPPVLCSMRGRDCRHIALVMNTLKMEKLKT